MSPYAYLSSEKQSGSILNFIHCSPYTLQGLGKKGPSLFQSTRNNTMRLVVRYICADFIIIIYNLVFQDSIRAWQIYVQIGVPLIVSGCHSTPPPPLSLLLFFQDSIRAWQIYVQVGVPLIVSGCHSTPPPIIIIIMMFNLFLTIL